MFNKNFGEDNSSFFKELKELPEEIAKEALKNESEKNKTGFLGKVFGSTDNTAIHIAGTIALILVIGGLISFIGEKYETYWKITTPIITSCLGYIFGKIK